MVRESARAGDALLRLGDVAGWTVAAPLAFAITQLVPGVQPSPSHPFAVYWPIVALSLFAWVAGAWLLQVYEARSRAPWVEVSRVTSALALVGLLAAAAVFFAKQQSASRLTVGIYFVLAWVHLVGIRLAIRAVLRAMGRSGRRARYYAVVGSGERVARLVETIRTEEWGLRLAGCILEEDAPATGAVARVLGTLSELPRIVEEHVLDEIVIAVPRERLPDVQEAILTAEELGVSVRISLDVMKFGRARMSVSEIAGVPMLALTRTPSDTLALAAKRAFDVVTSAAVLLLVSPLLGAIALAVKLDSPGPVLFRQRRVGLNGRIFEIVKFRSMFLDAEARLGALRAQNEMSGPVFKMSKDPRVTRVGRFIRRTSFDEFPQFWNVLRGEMSIVGPRPPLPSEVKEYKLWQRRRLSVKPGITCTWQISGRNQIDFERWMELDLQYIDAWSFWRDFRIFLQTIPAVLAARGAR